MEIARLPAPQRPINVLVFTPTPTHPPIQGNRQRAFDICRAIQSTGADITLLHYATEGVGADDAQRMKDTWGNLEVVFPRGFVPQHRYVRYPAIDDWFDGSIGDAALRLSAEKQFDICVTNYVWYSKIFDSLPPNIVRVIDTHDVFGGRAQRFAEIDLAPQWFHTSVNEEKIGLDRADFVLAIQDSEAEMLRQRTRTHVHTIGLLSAPDFLPVLRPNTGRPLRVGYVGSANPFNVSSMLSFARALQTFPAAILGFDVHLAGPICAALSASPHPFVTHGVVDSISDFYRSVDVMVNPMLGGTGLKIKSLEALGYGKPLVATLDAMAGVRTDHHNHRLANIQQVVAQLQELSENPIRLEAESQVSRRIFDTYREDQLRSFSHFWSLLEREVAARRTLPEAARKAGASI